MSKSFDLMFSTSTSQRLLPYEGVSSRSALIKSLISSSSSRSLRYKSSFEEEFFLLLDFLSTLDGSALAFMIKSYESLLSIYALSRYLEVKPHTNLRSLLLSLRFQVNWFDINKNFSPALHRDLIDLPFLLNSMRNLEVSSKIDNKLFRLTLIFEWLGEKTCNSEEDLENLRNCDELKEIKQVLVRENLTIGDYERAHLSILFPNTLNFLENL